MKKYAVTDLKSKGRKYDEIADDDRSIFQKDRDRIIHCRSFRRLNLKTQVFVAGLGDHYRTRLTHTLEVAQVSRDVARLLGLNEDLAETIALAHDLGHTPFGHAGEMAMDRCMQKFGLSFEHNEQSKRVVTKLERMYPGFPGLNLSYEVLDGLSKHQTPWDNPSASIEISPSLEAQVVNIADEIAYSNHDIDDGLRAGLLKWDEITELPIVRLAMTHVEEEYGLIDDKKILQARVVSSLIGLMIKKLSESTDSRLGSIYELKDVYAQEKPLVCFEDEFLMMMRELKEFLQSNFYFNEEVLKYSRQGEEIVEVLFDYFLNHPDEISDYLREDDDVLAVKDYICGMTDVYAYDYYKKITT